MELALFSHVSPSPSYAVCAFSRLQDKNETYRLASPVTGSQPPRASGRRWRKHSLSHTAHAHPLQEPVGGVRGQARQRAR